MNELGICAGCWYYVESAICPGWGICHHIVKAHVQVRGDCSCEWGLDRDEEIGDRFPEGES